MAIWPNDFSYHKHNFNYLELKLFSNEKKCGIKYISKMGIKLEKQEHQKLYPRCIVKSSLMEHKRGILRQVLLQKKTSNSEKLY